MNFKIFEIKIIVYLIFLPIWTKFILSFSVGVNRIQSGLMPKIYAITDGMILFGLIFWWVLAPPTKLSKTIIWMSFVLFFLNLLTVYFSESDIILQQKFILKLLIPILFFLVFKEFSLKYPRVSRDLTFISIALICFLTIFGFVFLENEINRQVEYMPAYFSGLHTTSYIWLGILVSLFSIIQKKYAKIICWFIVLMMVSVAWGVRTAQGAIILFGIFNICSYVKDRNLKISLSIFGFLVILIAILYTLMTPSLFQTVDFWSSGRVSMYNAKVDQLTNFGIKSILFGNGEGSDLITTDVWSWEKKGAHNDYFTILVEQGLLFFIGVMGVFALIIKSLNDSKQKTIFIIYLYTSAVSNGIMMRPLAAYMLFIACGVYYAQYAKNQRFNLSNSPSMKFNNI